MKKITSILFILIFAISLMAANKNIVSIKDTIKPQTTLSKIDSNLKTISRLEVAKANNIIDMTSMEDSTKEQLKSIVSDIPEAAKEVNEIVKVVQAQNDYSSKLEYYLYLLGAVVTFLTFLAGIVKKVRALPYWMSPIHWFEKLTGESKASLKGKKGSYKKVFIPQGKKIRIE